MATANESRVRFEGIAEGCEILGGTQANFVVFRGGQHAKEVSVLLNDPAAQYLAGVLGAEENQPFRESAVRHLGQAWVEMVVAGGRRLDSIIFLAKGNLEAEPVLIGRLKEEVDRATAIHAAHEAHAAADHGDGGHH